MPTVTEKNSKKQSPKNEGKRYRIVVDDAEQAVHLIKKHLGDTAKVLSVQQVKGKGLQRFLAAPKLEVIATVPPAKVENQQAQIEEKKEEPKETLEKSAKAESMAEESTEKPNENISFERETAPNIVNSTAEASEQQDTNYSFLNKRDRQTTTWQDSSLANNPVSKLLRSANFDESLVNRFECSPQWDRISSMPIHHALGELYSLLSEDYQKLSTQPLGKRVAFLGTPSVGKSTALCKQLANDVFLKDKKAQVLKLENDNPNPDDSLRVFCDALGVPLMRDAVDLDHIDQSEGLYIDLPGCPIGDNSAWSQLEGRLNTLNVDSRVLVINAAYDSETIKSAYMMGLRHKATHVVFTHLDESTNPTKLWQFLLCGGLSPLFYSYGQNATSEFSEAILEYMMDKTFPSTLIN